LAKELVDCKLDILVVENERTVRAAKKAAATVPIVVVRTGDPVGSGLVVSLARPGGNVTGLTSYSPELVVKRRTVEGGRPQGLLLCLSKCRGQSGQPAGFKEAQVTAKVLGVQFKLIEVKAQNPDVEGAFCVMFKERVGALVTSSSPYIEPHQKKILELVGQNRIPAMHANTPWVESGGLMSYGGQTVDLYRRVAVYVDKILKGSKPADLPIEGAMRFDFVINLKTAKQIGLTIPPDVLVRTTKITK
jgi:ABC-type uncharacterized transport system substrate-binding protein